MRYALTTNTDLDRIQRFMPSNYQAKTIDEGTLIYGEDSAGWTLDGYVIPRLASGLIFAKEIDRPTKWTAGWNMPGYLPETDPELFATWDEARGYIRDTIERFWDQDDDLPIPMRNQTANDPITLCCDRDAADCDCSPADHQWLEIHTQLPLATTDQPWSHSNGTNSLVFWITQAEDEEFNVAGDGS